MFTLSSIKRLPGLCSISFALYLLQISAPVAADSTDDLETLIVTADRVPQPASEIGSAVTVIQRSLIDDRQSIYAADLLQDVPGVSVSRLSGFGSQTQVRIRGAEANHVLVMIDGVKANDPAGNDEFDFSSLTTYDVDRIEVVRGPQSALWGSEATAGVINITTRHGTEPLEASGFLEAGSRDTLYTGARVSATSETASFSLNGSYLDTDGQSAALSGSEDDGYENLTLGFNSTWRPAERGRLGFSVRYKDSTTEFDGTDFTTGLPADADLIGEDELWLVKVDGGFSALDERWDNNLRLTYLNSDRQQYRDGDWESGTGAEKFGAYYQSTLDFSSAATAASASNASRQRQLVLAVDYEQEKFEQRGFGFFDPNQDQQRDNVGWVAEYLAVPIEGLNLSASVRYDNNSDFDNVATYRLTSSYLFSGTDTRLRASLGSGQKAPTFIELFGYFPDLFVGNPDLEPEKTQGFDIAVVQSWGRWQGSAGYFNERLTDEIVTSFVPDTFLSTVVNLPGKSRRQGLELELNGQLTADMRLQLSYTYTDSEQPDGSPEVRRPHHMAAANLNYRFADQRANVNLNASYTGSQQDLVFLPPLYSPEAVKLDQYLLVDLSGRYALSKRLELNFRVENLFDKDYTTVVGYRTPGRGIYAGVRLGLAH